MIKAISFPCLGLRNKIMVSIKNNRPTKLPISIEGAILATTKFPSPKAVSLTLDKRML